MKSEKKGRSPAQDSGDPKNEKLPGIKLDYKYKGRYGEVCTSGSIDNLEIPKDPSPDAQLLDVLITTPFGSFLIEENTEQAKEVIAKCKSFVEKSAELQKIDKELLPEANTAHNQTLARAQESGEDLGYPKTLQKVQELNRERLLLDLHIKEIKRQLESYM